MRLRQLEEELQDIRPSLAAARQERDVCQQELAALQLSYKKSQETLKETQQELASLRQSVAEKDERAEAALSPAAAP